MMRVWSVRHLEEMHHEYIPFEGEWYQAFGRPERSGCWIIYGRSGQGKSSFALQLARCMDRLGLRVLFLTLEMGGSADFAEALRAADIRSGTSSITFAESCTLEELDGYLSRQRSPDVVFIDSVQYFVTQCGATSEGIIRLRRRHAGKVFVFISHVDGREVEGKAAYDVKRDAYKRIWVDGFKATYVGRGKGGPRGYYIVWDKGFRRAQLENIREEERYGTENREETDGVAGDGAPSARHLQPQGDR